MRLRSASVTILLPMEISLVWLSSLLFHIRSVYSWQQETGRGYARQCLKPARDRRDGIHPIPYRPLSRVTSRESTRRDQDAQ